MAPAEQPDKPTSTDPGTSPDLLAAGSRPSSPWPAPFRLDQIVTPLRYDLALRLNPAEPTYSGTVSIPVRATKPVWVVRLHASGITIKTARALVQGRPITLEAAVDKDENLALSVPASEAHPLPTGTWVIELSFAAPLPEAPLGVYRAQEEGRWYAFTQFEPLEARQAFPCFDEPGIKVPFGVDLTVPDPMIAVANEPEDKRVAAEPGFTTFQFDDTPPLPTYLVAWAVGELDVVDYGTVSNGKVPFRIITAKGKGKLSAFAGTITPKHLDALEAWFGTPYPFSKLDMVAVPSFGSSGMENPGLITYRESLLLMDAPKAPVDDRLWVEAVIAHELAHMWFGDLVTLAWWDDIWLNEAFATFMSRKALAVVSPDLGVDLLSTRSRYGVMHGDQRPGARAIRQPIEKTGDIYNAFDGITYSKGAAVLRMLEAWMGEDAFQKGTRAYLAERAHGTATTADLLRHLQQASGLPVATVVGTFGDRAGVPVVDVRWSCPPKAEGATQAVNIELSQHAYRGPGDDRASVGADAPPWAVPVCIGFGGAIGQRNGRVCGLLQKERENWTQELPYCPTWIHPDIDEAGYYRWTSEPAALPDGGVSAVAQYGLLENLKVDMDAGRTPLAKWLDEVQQVARTKDLPYALFEQVTTAPGFIQRAWPSGEATDDPKFKAFVKRLLAQQAVVLDFGGPNASAAVKQTAPLVVKSYGGWLHDAKVITEAKKISESFLTDLEQNTTKTRFDLVAIYLPLYVGSTGDEAAQASARQALWTRLRAAFDKARNPNERDLLIEALGAFDDTELVVKSHGLLLDGTLRAQDMRTLRASTSGRREITLATWEWLTTHFDAVVQKIGDKVAPSLAWFGGNFCTPEDEQRVTTFFASKQASLPNGLERNVRNVRESIAQCIATRATYGEAAKAWVQSQP